MILYGSPTSPYVRHIRVALAQYGLDYQFETADNDVSDVKSPTKRVPFLLDGEMRLTDSSSILLHVKQKGGDTGFIDVRDFELYCLANTALEAELNLFFLAKDNISSEGNPYLQRQRSRVRSILLHLDAEFGLFSSDNEPSLTDGELRLACFLDWAIFRQRFSLDGLDKLKALLLRARENQHFIASAPPK